MRFVALLCLAVPALAACGGAQVTVQEVPGPPATVTLPGNPDALAPAASVTPSATATPAATTAAGAPAGTGAAPAATPGAAAGSGSGGGTGTGTGATDTTGGAQGNVPASPSPPPAGSNAQKFEDFCNQNPGAC